MTRSVLIISVALFAHCVGSCVADDLHEHRFPSDIRLNKSAAIALCKLKDILTNIYGGTMDYVVEEASKMADSIMADMEMIDHYVEGVKHYITKAKGDERLTEEESDEIEKLCEAALEKTDEESRNIVIECVDRISELADSAKTNAKATVGEEDLSIEHDDATGIYKVINWHCGGDKGGQEIRMSQNCDVIGRRRKVPNKDGTVGEARRNVIFCNNFWAKELYGETLPYQNVTLSRMKKTMNDWDAMKPKKISDESSKCKEGDYHTSHPCTVLESWRRSYVETEKNIEDIGTRLKQLKEIRFDGETQLLVLFKLHNALTAPGEMKNVSSVLNAINTTITLRERGKKEMTTVMDTLLDDEFVINETDGEKVEEARKWYTTTTFNKLMLYIFAPLGCLLIIMMLVFIIMSRKSTEEVNEEGTIAATLPADKVA